ncbi:MAG: galactose mutarotase [Kiritimatiellae bacterium]|jgi:aldose 1-epimerase|nr:galactose mutarotase [Kiritimatiellia bacterium]
MNITCKPYTTTPSGETVDLYTLENDNNISVKIITFGATIISIETPDKNGKSENILIEFNKPEEYIDNIYYLGSTVGRVCNRIKNAKFQLAGRQVNVDANLDDTHMIHGGVDGFSHKLWTANIISDSVQPALSMSYISPDGEAGFPGELQTTVIFTLNNENELIIEYKAHTSKETVVNFTNHAYFNLEGNDSISSHEVKINASTFLPSTPEGFPTGKIESVENTPFDLRDFKTIGNLHEYDDEQIKMFEGFDHNFIVDKSDDKFVAEVREPNSGRVLKIFSTEPGVQLYTANSIHEDPSKFTTFKQHCALCLETQHFPDSPNIEYFPSTTIKPGDKFKSKTTLKFEKIQ